MYIKRVFEIVGKWFTYIKNEKFKAYSSPFVDDSNIIDTQSLFITAVTNPTDRWYVIQVRIGSKSMTSMVYNFSHLLELLKMEVHWHDLQFHAPFSCEVVEARKEKA